MLGLLQDTAVGSCWWLQSLVMFAVGSWTLVDKVEVDVHHELGTFLTGIECRLLIDAIFDFNLDFSPSVMTFAITFSLDIFIAKVEYLVWSMRMIPLGLRESTTRPIYFQTQITSFWVELHCVWELSLYS